MPDSSWEYRAQDNSDPAVSPFGPTTLGTPVGQTGIILQRPGVPMGYSDPTRGMQSAPFAPALLPEPSPTVLQVIKQVFLQISHVRITVSHQAQVQLETLYFQLSAHIKALCRPLTKKFTRPVLVQAYSLITQNREPEAIVMLEHVIASNDTPMPVYTEALKTLAQCYWSQGRRIQAIAAQEAYLQHLSTLLKTPEVATPSTLTAQDWGQQALLLGQWLLEEHAPFQALTVLRQALMRLPNNPQVLSHMAYALFKLDDRVAAKHHYERALAYCAESPQTRDNPAWEASILKTLAILVDCLDGKRHKSMAYLERALAIDPNDPEVLTILADWALAQGQLDEALVYYRRLLDVSPDPLETYCVLGFILWQLDRNDEAIDMYHAVLAIDPTHAITLNNLGVIYLDEMHHPQAAQPYFMRALQANMTYTLASFNMGRAYAQQGLCIEAAQAFAHAKTLNHFSPEMNEQDIVDHLERLFLCQGQQAS